MESKRFKDKIKQNNPPLSWTSLPHANIVKRKRFHC